MEGLCWQMLLIVSAAVWLHSIPEISARGCGGTTSLRLRSTEPPPIDLSGLSPKQLQKLAQQLASLQAEEEEDQDRNEDEDRDEDEDLDRDRNEDELEDDENDHRGSSRPWNRVQRIIRRQLVKIPKRYLRKILRQFGLARSLEGAVPQAQLREYYLIPLE